MKVSLSSGSELDVLNKDELREVLGELRGELERDNSERVRTAATGQTDASGLAALDVYHVPLGMEFRLTRLVLELDGYTPAAPFTAANAWVEVHRSERMVDFLELASGIPAVSTDGGAQATHFRNGEKVIVRLMGVTGLGAGVNFHVAIEGDLYPMRSRRAG